MRENQEVVCKKATAKYRYIKSCTNKSIWNSARRQWKGWDGAVAMIFSPLGHEALNSHWLYNENDHIQGRDWEILFEYTGRWCRVKSKRSFTEAIGSRTFLLRSIWCICHCYGCRPCEKIVFLYLGIILSIPLGGAFWMTGNPRAELWYSVFGVFFCNLNGLLANSRYLDFFVCYLQGKLSTLMGR